MIGRRKSLIALSACALIAPPAARAQQRSRPARIGFLVASSPETVGTIFEVFKQRLAELGYVEGKDVEFEYRWAHGKAERFPQLAQELVALQPDVILVTGGTGAALAAQQATKSIPIVVVFQADPVASGLAKSLARPGGNVTGLVDFTNEAAPKRLELLLAVVPKLRRLVVLWPAADPQAGLLKSLQAAAQTVGVDVVAIEVSSSDIGASFTRMTREQVGAVLPVTAALAYAQRRELAELALRYRVPMMFTFRSGAVAGGLMSYGADLEDFSRRAAPYVDKILKGAKPADLPFEQPTKFEFVINLKTAKALGLTVPQSLLLRADELIQ